MSQVIGVLVTYRRPDGLARALMAIANQTLHLDHLVVVDNGGHDAHTRTTVDDFRAKGLGIELIVTDNNLGPAGGRAIGMEAALRLAGDRDWLVLFDDDDALPTTTILEMLVRFGEEQRVEDGAFGGVGLRGARFDRKRVRTVPISERELAGGVVCVDHLHGGFFPVYSAAAVREVGTFRPDFFYGFEELEYGLRMTEAGHALVVDGALWRECAAFFSDYGQHDGPQFGLDEPRWRRYYSLRNLLRIVIDRGHRFRAARVAFVRGIAKPVANLPLHPRSGLVHLSLGIRSIHDAWRGRLGAIAGVDPRDIADGLDPRRQLTRKSR